MYAHNGIFSLKKEGISNIQYNMDEPSGHYGHTAKRNKSVTKKTNTG
jgi:hypothetical protein